MISRELEVTFNLAVREAERRRHELVCVEHILWAMCNDAHASEILRNCGANIDKLKADLESYLAALNQVPTERDLQIEQTVAVTRILRRAAIHVQSSGKKEIDAGDVLAAMYREPDSHSNCTPPPGVGWICGGGMSEADAISSSRASASRTISGSGAFPPRESHPADRFRMTSSCFRAQLRAAVFTITSICRENRP